MRALPQWVVRKGKIPYNPQTKNPAKAGQADTWTTFENVIKANMIEAYDGIGFQFNKNGVMGVDFDHCIINGVVDTWVQSWVDRFNSYTEISPSGTGIHILCFGALPDKAVKTKKAELYDWGRYFTVTANIYGELKPLRNAQDEINALYVEIAKPQAPNNYKDISFTPSRGSFLDIGLKKDNLFKSLWDGNRATEDESSNDIALMNKLAYWCNCDEDSMITAFLESPHFRQKDEKHRKKAADRKDYLPRTASEAIQNCNKTAQQDNDDYIAQRRISAVEDFKALINATAIQSPEQLKKYALDDMGTAKLFADVFRESIMYVAEYKSYFTYSKGRWHRDPEDLRTKQYIKDFADMTKNIIPPAPMPTADGEKPVDPWLIYRKHHLKYRSLNFRDKLCRDAKSELVGSITEFDRQPFLFNCKNGVLDLNNGILLLHEAQYKLTKMANVVYNSAASCPRFIEFIDEITEGKKDRARMLQKALGYCLKGEANEECYFTVIGQKTRNGKGTLFDTVMNIFGSYGAQIDFNSLARVGSKDGSRATPDIARLVGIRLALSNEPDRGVYVNEALMKQLTGNDDITARPLYGDVIQFKPVFRLFVTANSKPSIADDSLFTSDRIKLLPFTRHFNEDMRDTNLKAFFRTKEAKSAILNWLIEGYNLYKAEGLKNTSEMEAMTAEYRKENDLIGLYLNDRVNLNTTNKVTIKSLRVDYESWCKVVGAKPLGLKLFKEDLEKKEIEIFTSHRQYVINGIIHGGFDYANEHF